MKKSISWLIMVGLAFSLAGLATAAEHPSEHPTKKSEAEHPKGSGEHPKGEHPKGDSKKAASTVTTEDLAKAITDYVEKDSALKGGHFLVYDPVNKETLRLKLDKVHKDRLSKVSDGVYFACADFKTPEGKTYDLDIFMKGDSAASLKPTEVSIHKEAGKARYGWVEENGMWKKKQN